MVIIGGIILGLILLFFVMAVGFGWLILFVIPATMLTILCIQTFLRIRDRNA